MSTTIQIILSPRANALLAAAPAWPVTLPRAIADALDKTNEDTTGYIIAKKLSRRAPAIGPKTTLGRITSLLANSAHPTKAFVTGDRILSSIGSNVRYAGVHEFGLSVIVQVRAFNRRQVSNDVLRGRGRRGFVARRKGERIVATGFARVDAHKRRVNYPARHMFRTGIEERVAMGAYSRAVSRAVIATLTLPPTTGGAA